MPELFRKPFFRYLFLFVYFLALSASVYAFRETVFLPRPEAMEEKIDPRQVLPDFHNDILKDVFRIRGREIFPAYRVRLFETAEGLPLENYEIAGFAYSVEGRGTFGPFRVLMGITPAGKITGVRLLESAEPSGIGEIFKGSNFFVEQFEGKEETDLWMRSQGGPIVPVSGALVFSMRMAKAVRRGVLFFEENRPLLMRAMGDILRREAEKNMRELPPSVSGPANAVPGGFLPPSAAAFFNHGPAAVSPPSNHLPAKQPAPEEPVKETEASLHA